MSTHSQPRYVWLVIHEKLPRYCHYLDNMPFEEAIETVNAAVVSVHSTEKAASKAAKRYFFGILGHKEDSGESDGGGYHYCADDNGDDCHAWDEQVYVQSEIVD